MVHRNGTPSQKRLLILDFATLSCYLLLSHASQYCYCPTPRLLRHRNRRCWAVEPCHERASSRAVPYCDVEHQRFSFLRKHGASVQTRTHRDLKQSHRSSPRSVIPRIAVLDQCGAHWMANWRAQFESFGITHLRSPMFFHGHPDIEAMQAYAHRMGREDELVEICGIVGQEKSKHQQKRKRYNIPFILRMIVETDFSVCRGKKLPRTDINERGRGKLFVSVFIF